jgi:hypothetical protein
MRLVRNGIILFWILEYRTYHRIFHKIIYWRLEVAHNQPVQRDRKWFAEAAPKLKQFWDEVLYYRNSPDKIKEILAPKRIKFEDL